MIRSSQVVVVTACVALSALTYKSGRARKMNGVPTYSQLKVLPFCTLSAQEGVMVDAKAWWIAVSV